MQKLEVKQMITELQSAIKQVADKYSLSNVTIGTVNLNFGSCDFRVTLKNTNLLPNIARRSGIYFPEEAFNLILLNGGKKYKIVDIVPSRHKFPVSIQECDKYGNVLENGSKLKTTASFINNVVSKSNYMHPEVIDEETMDVFRQIMENKNKPLDLGLSDISFDL